MVSVLARRRFLLPRQLPVNRARMTRPLGSARITRPHRYYGTVRHCSSHRYSAPCGFSRLGFSLLLRVCLPRHPLRAIESQLPTFHVGA